MGLYFSTTFYKCSYTLIKKSLCKCFCLTGSCQWLPRSFLSVLLIWLERYINLWITWGKGLWEKCLKKKELKLFLSIERETAVWKNTNTWVKWPLYGDLSSYESYGQLCSQCPVGRWVWYICAFWISNHTHNLKNPLALSNVLILSECKGFLKMMHIK